MADLLLIHGAGHGAWAWDMLIPALAALGHHARAIDLPGRGGAPATLAAQAQAVIAAAAPGSFLVGHSAGGFAVTGAAEAAPAHFAGLIYLCAFIPRPGASIADLRREGHCGLRGSYRVAPDRQSFAFDPARAETLFFHDCPDPAAAAARLCAEPVLPQETALARTGRAEALPRAAILCRADRAIPLATQERMAAGILRRQVLPASHSPFLSMPGPLATAIDALLR